MSDKRSIAPLYVVAGAPGVGKTTLLPELVGLDSGIVAIDMDELLEDGALIGVPIADPKAGPIWPAYNRMWTRIVDIVRRAGHPVILLTPTPSPDDLVAGDGWDGPVRWALLDCDDQRRLDRLRARDWPEEWIEDAMTDAAQTRGLIPTVIHTDSENAPEIAAQVLAWTESFGDRSSA